VTGAECCMAAPSRDRNASLALAHIRRGGAEQDVDLGHAVAGAETRCCAMRRWRSCSRCGALTAGTPRVAPRGSV
jgi:hypothetical protein